MLTCTIAAALVGPFNLHAHLHRAEAEADSNAGSQQSDVHDVIAHCSTSLMFSNRFAAAMLARWKAPKVYAGFKDCRCR